MVGKRPLQRGFLDYAQGFLYLHTEAGRHKVVLIGLFFQRLVGVLLPEQQANRGPAQNQNDCAQKDEVESNRGTGKLLGEPHAQ